MPKLTKVVVDFHGFTRVVELRAPLPPILTQSLMVRLRPVGVDEVARLKGNEDGSLIYSQFFRLGRGRDGKPMYLCDNCQFCSPHTIERNLRDLARSSAHLAATGAVGALVKLLGGDARIRRLLLANARKRRARKKR